MWILPGKSYSQLHSQPHAHLHPEPLRAYRENTTRSSKPHLHNGKSNTLSGFPISKFSFGTLPSNSASLHQYESFSRQDVTPILELPPQCMTAIHFPCICELQGEVRRLEISTFSYSQSDPDNRYEVSYERKGHGSLRDSKMRSSMYAVVLGQDIWTVTICIH